MHPGVLLQYLLPHRALSRVVFWATRWRFKPWKNLLIRLISRRFDIEISEAAETDPAAYVHFNAFFTRALKAGARPCDADSAAVLLPADGRISQLGKIENGRIFQAKGHAYSAAELLGDEARALPYSNGDFATVYLSPRDYHRVHMPLTGRLIETVHIPGRLFSVAPHTVNAVPRLFARNERMVCMFEGGHGPFAVVMVGAMLVSSVDSVWRGGEIPPYANTPLVRDYRQVAPPIALERFAEMGRFNMGSTVIVLFPHGMMQFAAGLGAGSPVRVGQRLGTLSPG